MNSTIYLTFKENRMEQDEEKETADELKSFLTSKKFGTTKKRENKHLGVGGKIKMNLNLLKFERSENVDKGPQQIF